MKKTPHPRTGSITQGRKLRLPLNSVLASSLVVASIPLLSHSAKAQTMTTSGNIAWSTTPNSANFGDVNWTAGTTGGAPAFAASSGNALFFDTSNITTLNNNLTAGTTAGAGTNFAGITFNSDASAYTITGNAFILGGSTAVTGSGAFVNNSATTETIGANATAANTASPVAIVLNAAQTFTTASGATSVFAGSFSNAQNGGAGGGNPTFAGAGLTILSGNNANFGGSIAFGSGSTLQLQFNAANSSTTTSTSAITGTAILTSNVTGFNSAYGLSGNNIIQLRGDSSTQVNTRNLNGFGTNTNITFDVNRLNSTTATGNVLVFNNGGNGSGGFDTVAPTAMITATGGNGYILGLNKAELTASGNFTLNPTTAGIISAGFTTGAGNNGTTASGIVASFTLGGTDTSGNSNVTGTILNTSTTIAVASPGVAAVSSIIKNTASTWTISNGASLYSGGTTVSAGTLILAATTAGTSTASATGTGGITVTGGTLQLANGTQQTTGASTLTLGGGTLNTNNNSQTFGALTLTASTSSTLNFGATGTATVTDTFTTATFGSGATLNIANYNSSLDTFNIGTTLTAAQLAQINDPGFTASQATGGNITFAPVPEPSTWMGGAFGLVALGWSLLRRRQAV